MKSTPVNLIILIGATIILVTFLLSSYKPITPQTATTTVATTTTLLPVKGELIIAVKDVFHKIPVVGTVYALEMTINSVEVHFVGEDESATGKWVSLFSGTKTLDLLKYTEVRAIIGYQELAPGKYTQIRLNISNSTIKVYNPWMHVYNKTYDLKVPSKELKIVHNFDVEANKTLVLTLDFDLEQSVHKTDQGYIFTPTVRVLEEKLLKGLRPTNSTIV
jgi:hypothetical protein